MFGIRCVGAIGVRVDVDATALLDPPTGVGVFVRELVAGLADRARRGEIETGAFAVSTRAGRLAPVVPRGVSVASPRPVPARLMRAAWARVDRPTAGFFGVRGEIVHGPNHVVPPAPDAVEIITIHDLTAVRYPHLCTPAVREWPVVFERAVRRGVWVHTPSRAVAREVVERWPAVADRVVAIPHGIRRPSPVDERTVRVREAVGGRLAGSDRYVLALGTVEPRKDLVSLVRAFEAVAETDPGLRLVVAGPDGWGTDEFVRVWRSSPFRRRIRRIGWVGDAMRTALLRGASLVAYPSLYEGFGLVPLEALALGVPVVATRIDAIEEVTGDAARLVEPGDVDGLAEAIASVLDDPAGVAEMLTRGVERVDALRWDDTIDAMVAFYRRALSG